MPSKKEQSARRGSAKGAKEDDEAAAAVGSDGLLATVKQLALGSVLVEMMPMLPKLMKAETTTVAKEEEKENKDDGAENKDESEAAAPAGDAVKSEEKPKDAASVFESLITRLPFSSALGLDKAPEEALLLFTRLEIDFGPPKSKKGNKPLERITVNMERNLSQYINITLVLMVLNALAFRSWFACLPWLVAYQMLSLNLPMDLIRENIPQVPEIALKFRVAATMVIHALVWAFFLYELLCQTYFLAKFPLLGLLVAHAYVVVPEVNLDAARSLIAEKKTAEAGDAKPQVAGTANAGTIITMIKLIVTTSFLAKLSNKGPQLIDELKGATSKRADAKAEPKKKETNAEDEGAEKETKDEDTKPKDTSSGSVFEPLMAIFSIYNVLGLGAQQGSVESWRTFVKLNMDFGPKDKKGGAIKERLMTNFERNMPQYLHIFMALMCVRSFLFRSFFACLPWLVAYQMVCVSLPLIRAKVPQVPPVDLIYRIAATGAFNALTWLFFAYESTVMTHLLEKILFTGLFAAHAYVVSPVAN